MRSSGLGRVARWGRPAIAAGLLAVLWVGTVNGVDRTTRDAEQRRKADQLDVARAFATVTASWMDEGRATAARLGAGLGGRSGATAQPDIDSTVGGRRAWATGVLVVDPAGAVVAASRDRLGLIGRVLPPCTRTASDGATADNGLAELVATGIQRPVISRLIEVAPGCEEVVAAAAPAAGRAVILIAGREALVDRLAASRHLDEDTRLFLLDPTGRALTADGGEPAPAHVAATERDQPGVRTVPIGADAAVVQAVHPVVEGWSIVVETNAAAFAPDVRSRPAIVVAGVLTVVFGAAFVLVTVFDIRRQRAQRRTDLATQAFLSIVNHELRTPLTVLRGSTDLMVAHWDRLDKDQLGPLVENLGPQVQRLSRVVDRLLIAANIQAGVHQRPVVGPTAIEPVAERVFALFADGAPLHTFSYTGSDGDRAVMADEQALEQVLVQAVDNAVKYSPAGGPVVVSTRARRGRIEIAIDDDGVGLPTTRSDLFAAFTQGEAVDRRLHVEGGVGVGLYIVRTLVREMGGDVRAEPGAGGGARLVITLPAAKPQPYSSGPSPTDD